MYCLTPPLIAPIFRSFSFSIQPTQSEFNASGKVQEEQKRRLYKIFGENAKGTQEERDEEIAEYQRQLVEKEFGESKNKLRDYQAEGVAWLMSNYVNNRSSVLADEVSSLLLCDIRLLLLPERFPL